MNPCTHAAFLVLLMTILGWVTPLPPAVAAEDDFSLLFRGGTSYYRVPGESLFGGAWNIETAFPVSEDVGLTVSANVNHLSGGSQVAGSTGIVKLPARQKRNLRDSFTAAVVFDQVTDSRVNTFTGSFYTNQLRWQGGFQIEDDLEIGVSGNVPLYETDDVVFKFVNFPGSLPVAGIVSGSVSYGGYITGNSGPWQRAFYAGIRELPGTVQLSSSTRYRIDEGMAAIASATFEERHSNWNLFVGLEIDLGRRPRAQDRSGHCIRAQSPSSPAQMTAYVPPGAPQGDPKNEIREFNLNLEQDVDKAMPDEQIPAPPNRPTIPFTPPPNSFNPDELTFGYRWKIWDGRLELNRSQRDIILSLDGHGLANRAQDLIQAGPSGGYPWGPNFLNGRLQD